jgi:inositol polyphosphate 5-phosphatase INPP5B/F
MATAESLYRAVYDRREEYIRPHRIRIKVGTWNVAACPGTDKDVASWFLGGEGVDTKLAGVSLADNPAVERPGHASGSHVRQDDGVRLLGGDKIGLYVLGLQEVVDLNAPGQYVRGVYAGNEQNAMEKWKTALEKGLPAGYTMVAMEQMSGLLMLIYASEQIAATITNVSSVSVGTGLLGYLGNKGAVCTRIMLGEATRLVFVDCHLASGNDAAHVDRRTWDVTQIASRARFEGIKGPGIPDGDAEKIGDEDFAFWFGDLNFRLDGLPGDDIRRLLMLHTRGEYDVTTQKEMDDGVVVLRRSGSSEDLKDKDKDKDSTSSASTRATRSTQNGQDDTDESSITLPDPDDFPQDPSQDPASLQATLDSLLPHDQLRRMMKQRKVFQDGWREGNVTFLPSYKYDIGTVGLFDSSEKRRAPSWCDRILFRTRRDKEEYEAKLGEEREARKKDEQMKAQGMEQAGEDDDVLFSYDPDKDGESEAHAGRNNNVATGSSAEDTTYDEYDEDADDETEVVTKEGAHDRIRQEIYTSHQQITSSDHKPIDSIFVLDYDGVVPELKAKVHAEVARELDRAENEGRPGITIVAEGGHESLAAEAEVSDRAGQTISFGNLVFLQKRSSTLTVANTSGVAANFNFVEKPSTEETEGNAAHRWLATAFKAAAESGEGGQGDKAPANSDLDKDITLEPGDTVQMTLTAYVDDVAYARQLNDGHAQLEDVLVLRVKDGRDHFLPVNATWLPTCIGRSVDELIRVPDGGIRAFIKQLSEQNKNKPVGSIPYDLDVHRSAPKELFKLTEIIETLTERALADEQMIEAHQLPQDAGWPFDEKAWKHADSPYRAAQRINLFEALDHDKPLMEAFNAETPSSERLEVACEVLLIFLRGLTDGVIPLQLWAKIEQAHLPSLGQTKTNASLQANTTSPDFSGTHDEKTTILDILSSYPNHNISFVFLTTTLSKIIAELCPISKAEAEALKSPVTSAASSLRGLGALGRRSLSFRRSGGAPAAEALAARDRRVAKERRVSEVFGVVVCRVPLWSVMKDKERRAVEEKQRGLVELFLRRDGE